MAVPLIAGAARVAGVVLSGLSRLAMAVVRAFRPIVVAVEKVMDTVDKARTVLDRFDKGGVQLRVEGFNHFKEIAKKIERQIEELQHRNAERLAELLADEAPVDTGALSRSFVVRHGRDGSEVYSTVDYALPVNDGHHTAGGGWVPGDHFRERAMSRLRREMAAQRWDL